MIIIDGLIASGKSSILKEIQSRGYKIELQRISKWKYLSSFYEKPVLYAPLLQDEIISSYEDIYQENKGNITFCESYAGASMNTFVKMSESRGQLTENHILELKKKYTNFKPSLYIWLNVDIDTCMKRIKIRSRPGEENIKREYLEDLKEKYEEFMKNCDFPVFRMENNKEGCQKEISDNILKLI